jgi:hypothetical protein
MLASHRESEDRTLALAQGAYYFATGVWPILHLRSFEKVTGPKPEGWLVKTVGALIAVIGTTVGLAGWRRRISPEIRILAAGSAAALGVVDVIYPAKRRISPIYLADALPEAALTLAWVLSSLRRPAKSRGVFRSTPAEDPALASKAVRAAGMAITPAG